MRIVKSYQDQFFFSHEPHHTASPRLVLLKSAQAKPKLQLRLWLRLVVFPILPKQQFMTFCCKIVCWLDLIILQICPGIQWEFRRNPCYYLWILSYKDKEKLREELGQEPSKLKKTRNILICCRQYKID